MKSAYELAMERLGGSLNEYTDEQKEQLAEVDRLYDSKVAQAKFAADDRRRKAGGNPEQLKQIDDDYIVEVASLNERREKAKEELRGQFQDN